MFQLLDEYGIKSFRVETADYTVRAFANPEKTRFSSINLLDVPEYNDAIRRKPARPPFVYSVRLYNYNPLLFFPKNCVLTAHNPSSETKHVVETESDEEVVAEAEKSHELGEITVEDVGSFLLCVYK